MKETEVKCDGISTNEEQLYAQFAHGTEIGKLDATVEELRVHLREAGWRIATLERQVAEIRDTVVMMPVTFAQLEAFKRLE